MLRCALFGHKWILSLTHDMRECARCDTCQTGMDMCCCDYERRILLETLDEELSRVS